MWLIGKKGNNVTVLSRSFVKTYKVKIMLLKYHKYKNELVRIVIIFNIKQKVNNLY